MRVMLSGAYVFVADIIWSMRQIVTTTTGDIDVLKVQQKPDLTPGEDEVVIRVRAAGLNFADILSRQGLYPDSPPKPCVMGYEVSGIVETVGKGVNSSFVGKSVAAFAIALADQRRQMIQHTAQLGRRRKHA